MFDLTELKWLEQEKLVRSQRHPTFPITIWNYSEKCQYDRVWTPMTLAARGLILDDDGNVVARGMLKFFNYGERSDPLPNEEFKVFDKVDGSLVILCNYAGKRFLATRGSFDGPQAQKATVLFNRKYWGYVPPIGKTAVFEYVADWDRKVVKYPEEQVVHLGLVDNKTGLMDYDLDPCWHGPEAEVLEILHPEKLKNIDRFNKEGFVVRYKNGYQIKIKHDEYMRVHRAMFCTSTRSIWESLSSGKTVQELYEGMPDEVMPFVKEHAEKLFLKWSIIEDRSAEIVEELYPLYHKQGRAAFAKEAVKRPYSNVIFAMLDGKDHSKIIWKMIEPDWVPARAIPEVE